MTIHVNIGEAKSRLAELVAAALRGEDVVLASAGAPQVRLVPVPDEDPTMLDEVARSRRSAFGMYRHLANDQAIAIDTELTDEQWDAHYRAKFADPD